jgi:hypothetical protein
LSYLRIPTSAPYSLLSHLLLAQQERSRVYLIMSASHAVNISSHLTQSLVVYFSGRLSLFVDINSPLSLRPYDEEEHRFYLDDDSDANVVVNDRVKL